jgi:predicted glycosyltransferase
MLARTGLLVSMGGYNTAAEIIAYRKAAPLVPRQHPRRVPVAIHLSDATEVRLAVLLVPLREGEAVTPRPPEVAPLA